MKKFLVVSMSLLSLLLSTAALHAQASDITVLSVTPGAFTPGTQVTAVAYVEPQGGTVAPTGTVTFQVDGQSLYTAAVVHGAAQISTTTATLAPGTYSVVAGYGGDRNYAPSVSSPASLTVQPFPTQTALTFPSQVTAGSTVLASATVTSSSGSHPLTGTVSFSASGSVFTTLPLVNGVATINGPAAQFSDGTYQVTAQYNGDPWNAVSDSATQTVTLSGRTTTAVSATPSTQSIGSPVTFNVNITTDSASLPTGTAGIYFGNLLLGQGTVTGGTASITLPTNSATPNAYSVTARYLGDANNAPSAGSTTVNLTGVTTAYTLSPVGAAITPGGTASFSVTPAPSTAVAWYVNGVAGGSSALGTIDANGNYTSPSAAQPLAVQITAVEPQNPYAYAAAEVYVVVPGSAGKSNDPQVASYQIQVPQGGEMSVEFGLDTTYGRSTWQQPPPSGGGAMTMLVAGMVANTTYHMRADVAFPNGITYHDPDQTFATGYALAKGDYVAPATTITTSSYTPQPGVEIVDPVDGQAWAYDLQGNFIWGLNRPADAPYPSWVQPIKLMSNGHLLVQVTPESAFPVDGTSVPSNAAIAVYEMELDGTIVKELTLAQLNANLLASGYKDGLGNTITLLDIHHEASINPVNNHWLLMTNTERTETLTGESSPQTMLGDVVVDVDPNNNFAVDWVWNEFDHLSVNRHPVTIPDWTHSNAILYSPDDHQILVSSRAQSWIMKVNYLDGSGDGTLLWRFGYQGDFTLVNGTSPTDWQYGQHEMAFTTPNSSGVFGITMMDNGDYRVFPTGYKCQDGTSQPCHYSRMPQFTVDETAMTATLTEVPPFSGYSNFGGNAEVLANGDSHADFCATLEANDATTEGVVVEYTPGNSPQLVWSMTLGNNFTAYRAHRWGSFYPGVTWTQ